MRLEHPLLWVTAVVVALGAGCMLKSGGSPGPSSRYVTGAGAEENAVQSMQGMQEPKTNWGFRWIPEGTVLVVLPSRRPQLAIGDSRSEQAAYRRFQASAYTDRRWCKVVVQTDQRGETTLPVGTVLRPASKAVVNDRNLEGPYFGPGSDQLPSVKSLLPQLPVSPSSRP